MEAVSALYTNGLGRRLHHFEVYTKRPFFFIPYFQMHVQNTISQFDVNFTEMCPYAPTLNSALRKVMACCLIGNSQLLEPVLILMIAEFIHHQASTS